MSAPGSGFGELILPEGETLLWQGGPGVRTIAIRVFHLRPVAAYFALLFVARVVAGVIDHQPIAPTLASASWVLVPAFIVISLLYGLSILYSRTTRYSVTSRRVLLQYGAVLPMTLNVPLAQIARADVRLFADGSGDMPLGVVTKKRLSYLLLWPHARPWRLNQVEPMLRGVPDARHVGEILAKALAAAAQQQPGTQPLADVALALAESPSGAVPSAA